jgi:hypothetical protein
MPAFVVMVLMAVVAALAVANMRAARPAASRKHPVQVRAHPAGAPRPESPRPMTLEWGATIADPRQTSPAVPGSNAVSREAAVRATIRDRYVAVRFPGIAKTSADLEKIDRVIPAARLFFEEGQPDRALELLHLAGEQRPTSEPVRLAELEIAFLVRDKALFIDRARDFRHHLPASKAWGEIARLGHALSPGEALFGPAQGPKGTEHFGPWPDTPNWIQASWDLTAEVLASDLHRAMKNRAKNPASPALGVATREEALA